MADGKRERGFTVVNIVGMGENMVEQYFKFLGKGEVPFAFTEGPSTEDPITGKRKLGKTRCTLELPPPGPDSEAASVTAEATTKESAQASVVLLANAELMARGWFSEEKAHEAFVASISGQEGGGDARQRGSSAVVDKVMGIMTDLKKPTPVAPEPDPVSAGAGGDGLAGATIDLSGNAGTGSAAGDGTGSGQTSGNSTASGARELLASITGALTGTSSPPAATSQGNGLMLAASSEAPSQTAVPIHSSTAPLYNAGDSSAAAGSDETSELRLRERKIPRMFVLMAIVECAMVLIFATVYLANKEDGLVYGTMILCSLFCVYFARNAIWTENQLDLYCFLIVRSILSAYIVITLIEDINATVTNEILAAPFILVNFSYIYLAYQIRKLYGWVLFKRKSASVMEAGVYAQYQVLVATLKLGLLYGGAVGLSGSFVCITGCYYAFLVLTLVRLLGAISGALIGFAAARRVSDAHQAGPRLTRVFILWRLGELVASVLAFLALAFIDKPSLNKSWYHLLLFAIIDVALLVYSAISSNRLLRKRNEASAGALLDSASLEQPLMHGSGH